MKIALIIATTGRPDVLAQMLARLRRQSRHPDTILVVGANETDFPDRQDFTTTTFATSPKGSSKQRNVGIDRLGSNHDVLVFMDDDFVAAKDFFAGVERLMAGYPDVVAASGFILADGCRSAGLTFAEADALIASYENEPDEEAAIADQRGAYGCNMIIRAAARPAARFDENLPLFGWLEDVDYSYPFREIGRIVEASFCVGVHLGVKSGRTPGVALGYSQIANPFYIARKGTITHGHARSMMVKNLIANTMRSFAPEAYIDRHGRLKGNLLALYDIIRGRSHPTRVLALRHGAPSVP